MDKNIQLEIPVTVYGNMERYNDVISKARCRIFYKYENRNGAYITDEFADLLLSTIPYAPVKGIYDRGDEDYTDHGERRDLGRIYGVVPENPNLSWELHLDEDGVEREYACVDVLIFTGLYKEAEQIVGKSQSMEIYDKSIEGDWQFINGKKYFVFKKGSFLGLQVLGDNTEPCFQGASFFSLLEPLAELMREYENFQKQGGHKMPKLNFKLSDNQKYDMLWELLNSNYNEENGWVVNYTICEIYDEYAVVRNYENNSFERVYYTKNDETDSISIDKVEQCYIVDVTKDEYNALKALQLMNNGNYEKIDETFDAQKQAIAALTENNSNFEQKIEELNSSISTLTTERDEAATSLESAQVELSSLKEANESLAAFKAGVEKAEKESIIASYSEKLSEEIIEKYTNNLDNYSAIDLKKNLAYDLVETNPAVFSASTPKGFVPKDELTGGITEILSRYKNI